MRKIMGCSSPETSAAEYKLLNWAKLVPDANGIIYWHVANFTSKMDKFKVLFAFQTCFNKWQEAFDAIEPVGRSIELKPTDDYNQAQIRLFFIKPKLVNQTVILNDGTEKNIKNPFPFDGAGGVLAHRLPNSFDLYFDEDEQWSEIHKFEKIGEQYVLFVQLWQVAMHELGHMFDIGHASDKKALMFPTYDGEHIDITSDDLKGLAAGFSKVKQETKSKLPMPPTVLSDPRVKHIQGTLAKGPKPYNKRSLSAVRQIVVHHTADNGTPESIAKYHVNNNKWPGIGYHFLIDNTGQIFQTNDLDTISYNVANQNTKTIGICLIGNFEKEQPSTAQIDSLKWLLSAVRGVVGELPLYGHKDRDNTLCPGKNLYALLKSKDVS
jgi:hypothetical protein